MDCERRNKKPIATLLTSHVWSSQRKAGFHWIADGLLRRGWHVNFVTGYSWLDHLRGGYRRALIDLSQVNTPLQTATPDLVAVINAPILRPIGLKVELAERLTAPLARLYRHGAMSVLRRMVTDSRLVIMESTYEIMFTPTLRMLAPRARFVYRVSDDLTKSRVHSVALQDEMSALKFFDLVSVPDENLLQRFRHCPLARVQKHGIPTDLYSKQYPNPYLSGVRNAVFTGNNLLDENAISLLSHRFPDVRFHIFGPFAAQTLATNIHYYGEMAYKETIPYVVHADVGLNTLTLEGFAESNKMQQYRYCGLPVVLNGTPSREDPDRFTYRTGDLEGMVNAFATALARGRNRNAAPSVRSWDDLVADLLGEGEVL